MVIEIVKDYHSKKSIPTSDYTLMPRKPVSSFTDARISELHLPSKNPATKMDLQGITQYRWCTHCSLLR